MADVLTGADSLALFHSGASVAGGAQGDPDACLGGFRAADRVKEVAARIESPIPPLRIDRVYAGAGAVVGDLGVGVLSATDGDTVQYEGPDAAYGTAVEVLDGETKLVESADPAYAVVVTREWDDDFSLNEGMQLGHRGNLNNALGMSNLTSAQRTTGIDRVRSVFAVAAAAQDAAKVFIPPRGTAITSNTGQLGGSGAGTISTDASTIDPDIPQSGHAAVFNGSSLREVVYYTSRTDTALTVPAAGRGRLGTSAAAGAATDTIKFVPGTRIAKETPSAGAIQTVADEETLPTGVTWVTPYTAATALDLGAMTAGQEVGLWIRHELPAGAVAIAGEDHVLALVHTPSGGASLTRYAYGQHLVADDSLQRFELHHGTDAAAVRAAMAAASTPADTASTLNLSDTLAAADPGEELTHYWGVLERNAYNLASFNRLLRAVTVDENGVEVTPAPSALSTAALTDLYGGQLALSATYPKGLDGVNAANGFRYWVAAGRDPDTGTDTPVDTAGMGDVHTGRSVLLLEEAIGPYALGADIRVKIAPRRSADGVLGPVTQVSLTVGTGAPQVPSMLGLFLGDRGMRVITDAGVTETYVVDAGAGIEWRTAPGKTDLWAGSDLLLRFLYDTGANAGDNGLWTPLGWRGAAVSGAASGAVVHATEVVQWDGSVQQLYVTVGGVRRLFIDNLAETISFVTRATTAAAVAGNNGHLPLVDLTFHTCGNVWDRTAQAWTSVLSLAGESGGLTVRGGISHVAVGNIPDV